MFQTLFMKKLLFSAAAVLTIVGSAMAFRSTDKVFCLNTAGTACNVQTPQQSVVDRGLGIIATKQCAATATNSPCPAITIYRGL